MHLPEGFSWIQVGLATLVAVGFVVCAYMYAGVQATALDLPTILRVRICGDGIKSVDEVCDDGTAFNFGGYASSTASRHCEASCESFGPYCGDGILQVRYAEQCDDGNNTSGDLCSLDCLEETPAVPRATGAPPRGPVAPLPAIPGQISGELLTKVVLRGKAYPNSVVNILLDGKPFGTVTADTNADFLYTTTNITPGTATFSFNAKDRSGVSSITQSTVFDVVQSAVTTVANILLPPTITAKPDKVAPGGLVMLSGQSAPAAHIVAQVPSAKGSFEADADAGGDWALQLDTKSLENGPHSAKALFQYSDTIKSGFGKSVSFYVGTAPVEGCGEPDMNGDSKVNLVDFSIFLLSWNTTEQKADYNCDTRVNLADFSILLFEWTG